MFAAPFNKKAVTLCTESSLLATIVVLLHARDWFIYLFIYLFNSFIGYVYKLKMNTYTRKETKNG